MVTGGREREREHARAECPGGKPAETGVACPGAVEQGDAEGAHDGAEQLQVRLQDALT